MSGQQKLLTTSHKTVGVLMISKAIHLQNNQGQHTAMINSVDQMLTVWQLIY